MTNITNQINSNYHQIKQEEQISKKLEHLSIAPYSTIEKLEINDALNTIFDRGDIYGRKIHNIVTNFLDYSSCCGASSRFETLIEKIQAIIHKNNQNKSPSCEAAVILQTSYDHNECFNNTTILSQLEKLAERYYLALRVIGLYGETLKESINTIAKELNGRSIMTLIIRAHGNKDSVTLGKNNFYTIDNVDAEDFAPLNPNANIIFESCFTGCNLAKRIAAIQPRKVIAFPNKFNKSFLTHCCAKHGYCVVAFDKDYIQIAKIFEHAKNDITESIPCCATGKRLEIVKSELASEIKTAAKSENAIAQFHLGSSYYNGQGLPKSYVAAAFWFRKAAEQRSEKAQFNLGLCYDIGKGVTKSYDEAVIWYQKAAEQGLAEAQLNLGLFYINGQGVPRSHEKAAKLFRKAADKGNADAQLNLGYCYYGGYGVTKSHTEAAIWFKKTADQGNVEAKYQLSICNNNQQKVS